MIEKDRQGRQDRQEERIDRIIHMEELYDEIYNTLRDAEDSKAAALPLRGKIRELEEYYEGPQWISDLEADRAGLIPQNLKKGILSEDAIYDLLCDIDVIE